MLTVCPKCTLTLAVTAADLRMGQGYVRCGRCATVFNALLALTDSSSIELPSLMPPASVARAPGSHSATTTVSVPGPRPRPEYVPQPESWPGPAATAPEARIDDAAIDIDAALAAEPLDIVLEQTATVANESARPAAFADPSAPDTAPEDAPPEHAPAEDASPEEDAPEEDAPEGDAPDGDAPGESDPPLTDTTFEPATSHVGLFAIPEVEIDSLLEPSADIVVDDDGDHAGDAGDAGDDAHGATGGGIEAHEASADSTSTVQTIVLEGNSVSQSEEFVDIDTIDSEIALATRRALEAEARQSIASLDADDDARAAGAATVPAGESRQAEPVETRLSETGSVYVYDRNSLYAQRLPPPRPVAGKAPWIAGAMVLTLLLGVQAIHFWRNDLALRNDWIGRAVTQAYSALGLPLTPHWDLHGYDVRQLGAATNGNGDDAIRVRISLSNKAPRPQPYPILRLSLYDRYGKRVAARDLQPRDYLPKDHANGLMAAALQVESEVAVMDPGPDASSFELDVCIPAEHGLRCAGDSPLLPAKP